MVLSPFIDHCLLQFISYPLNTHVDDLGVLEAGRFKYLNEVSEALMHDRLESDVLTMLKKEIEQLL
jgi:hypothetical protein